MWFGRWVRDHLDPLVAQLVQLIPEEGERAPQKHRRAGAGAPPPREGGGGAGRGQGWGAHRHGGALSTSDVQSIVCELYDCPWVELWTKSLRRCRSRAVRA